MLQPGEVVGAYRIGRYLGEGPFGVVWQATASNGAPVALKLLKPGFIERPDGQAAFARLVNSVRLHAQVNHPNLARVYGAIQEPSRQLFGIVVEYCGGQLLSEIQLPPPPGPGGDPQGFLGGLLWFEELAGAVGWLHDQGIVHGNMKLRNVMLVRDPRAGGRVTPKLMDLSWASIGVAPPVPGTLSFLSPEQIQATPPTAASDQYSLAAMLNHMLTQGHAGGQNLPAVLVMTIQRALSSMPYQRFRHITELASGIRALRAELGQKQSHPAPTFAPLSSSMDPGQGSNLTAPRNPTAGHGAPQSRSQSTSRSAHQAPSTQSAGPGRMRIPKGSTVPMQSVSQSVQAGPRGALGGASPVGFHDDPPTQKTTRDQMVEPPTARFPNPMLPQSSTSNGGFPPTNLSVEQPLFKDEGFADRDSPSSDFPLVPQARPLIPREDTDAANVAHHSVEPVTREPRSLDEGAPPTSNGGMAFDPNVVDAAPEGPSMGFDQVDIQDQGPGIEQAPSSSEAPVVALVPHQNNALSASAEPAPWSGLKTNMELPEESIADGPSPGAAGASGGRSKLFALGFLLLVLALGILGGAWTVLNKEKSDQTAVNQIPPPPESIEPPVAPPEPKVPPEEVVVPPSKKEPPVRAPKSTKPRKTSGQASKRQKPNKTPEEAPKDLDIDRAMEKIRPRKTEPDALMVACDEGNGNSCFQAARKLRATKAPNEKIRETFERACRFKYAGGCVAAAKLWRQVDSAEAKRKALDLYQTACDRNLASGCALAASMWAEGFGVAKDKAKADALDAKACKLGRKTSCHEPKPAPPKPPEVKAEPAPETKPAPEEKPAPEPKPAPEVKPTPEVKPAEVKPEPVPEPEDDLKPAYTKPTKTSTGA